MNKGKTVLLGISGGIAAYKMLEVIKKLYSEDISVGVILTKSAEHFVSAEECKKSGAQHVYINLFAQPVNKEKILTTRIVEHIAVAKRADLLVIAPATSDIIAKLTAGITDDYLTTVALAATCPITVFPSMNTHMWTNPATQENIYKLGQRGIRVITPGTGKLACGDEGKGRLPEVEEIIFYIKKMFQKREELKGKKIVVTLGGTREYIDDVRFITNSSSGKMGAAIADSCFLKGAEVISLRAVDAISPRFANNEKIFETADQLEELLKKEIDNADMVIHVAAVSDFQIKKQPGKIDSEQQLSLQLELRKKILSKLKIWNPKCFVVGFKAVWNVSESDLVKSAKKLLHESQVDMIVANDVGKKAQGFGEDTNKVIIVNKSGIIKKIPLASKTEVAERIVDTIL